jgi:hypothetical protein
MKYTRSFTIRTIHQILYGRSNKAKIDVERSMSGDFFLSFTWRSFNDAIGISDWRVSNDWMIQKINLKCFFVCVCVCVCVCVRARARAWERERESKEVVVCSSSIQMPM